MERKKMNNGEVNNLVFILPGRTSTEKGLDVVGILSQSGGRVHNGVTPLLGVKGSLRGVQEA